MGIENGSPAARRLNAHKGLPLIFYLLLKAATIRPAASYSWLYNKRQGNLLL